MKPAGRVTPRERRLAHQQDADLSAVLRIGQPGAAGIGGLAQARAVRAFRGGRDPVAETRQTLAALVPILVWGMIYARLMGIDRARTLAPQTISAARPKVSGARAYRRAAGRLIDRLAISPATLTLLEDQFQAQALRVVKEASGSVERGLQETVAQMHLDGVHVREGVKRLGEAFDRYGLTPTNSFMLEAIVRTQSALAYSAGKLDVERSDAIDEILWGYKYVTVGDDRVRDRHIALEGTVLPKTDPFWQTHYPPNGWACRCQAIPIYDQRAEVRAPEEVEIDDRIIRPGADPGFGYDAARLFGRLPSSLFAA